MIDLRKANRSDRVYGVLVHPHNIDDEYDEIDLGEGAVLNYNYYSDERVTGSFCPINFPDINNRLLRIYYETEIDGERERMELETLFMRRRSIAYAAGAKDRDVELHSRIYRWVTDYLAKDVMWHPTTPAINHLNFYFNDLDEAMMYYDPAVNIQKKPASSVCTSKVGEKFLKTINFVADYIGAGALDVDTHGKLVMKPYLAPADRPVVWTFVDDENCMYADELTIDSLEDDIPSGINVYSSKNGGMARRMELPSSSPYSYYQRGRRVHAYYRHDELETSDQVAAKCKEYYDRMLSLVVSVEISHYFAPIRHGDAVRFVRAETGTDVVGIVHAMDRELKPGIPTRTVLDIVNGALGNVYP
ncbi:MAG: hypothetical protein LBI64_00630 [Coriobacteriales bacterium]|jgi:hypothetical protein|nr:hypothetical protein [Coriobacteriales bacterium]